MYPVLLELHTDEEEQSLVRLLYGPTDAEEQPLVWVFLDPKTILASFAIE